MLQHVQATHLVLLPEYQVYFVCMNTKSFLEIVYLSSTMSTVHCSMVICFAVLFLSCVIFVLVGERQRTFQEVFYISLLHNPRFLNKELVFDKLVKTMQNNNPYQKPKEGKMLTQCMIHIVKTARD